MNTGNIRAALACEQRKRAMFWLAQSESKGAQTYLE